VHFYVIYYSRNVSGLNILLQKGFSGTAYRNKQI
jgi:hypothetical protein